MGDSRANPKLSLGHTYSAMDDFEFIEKEELIDEKPEEGITEASESCHEAEAVSGDGMPTEQQHETASVKSFEGDEPPKNIVPLEVSAAAIAEGITGSLAR